MRASYTLCFKSISPRCSVATECAAQIALQHRVVLMMNTEDSMLKIRRLLMTAVQAVVLSATIASITSFRCWAGETPASAPKPGEVVTTQTVVICPSLQSLMDVYRMFGNGAGSSAFIYADAQKCQTLDKGVHLILVEKTPAVSRVALSHVTGILSVSTDIYYAATETLSQ